MLPIELRMPANRAMAWAFYRKELAPVRRFLMVFCSLNLLNGIALSATEPFAGLDPGYFRGSVVVLLTLVPGMFGHVAFSFERKRRHAILLRSLPVSNRFIVWMKLGAAWSMALMVTAPAATPLLLAGRGPDWKEWLVLIVLVATLIASLVLTGTLFRNEMAQNLPLLVVLFGSALTSEHWGELFEWISGNGVVLICLGVGTTVFMAESAATILQRRELDW